LGNQRREGLDQKAVGDGGAYEASFIHLSIVEGESFFLQVKNHYWHGFARIAPGHEPANPRCEPGSQVCLYRKPALLPPAYAKRREEPNRAGQVLESWTVHSSPSTCSTRPFMSRASAINSRRSAMASAV